MESRDAPQPSFYHVLDNYVPQVLAGALQDDCRAVLRGERTFGKGLVQAVYGLADGQGLIMTVAQYETPRGTYIHVRAACPPCGVWR